MRVVAVVVAVGLAALGASACGRMQALSAVSGAPAAPAAGRSTAPAGNGGAPGGGSVPAGGAGAELPAAPGRAMLVSGPLAFRGLPFFAPNALPGLSGVYALAPPAAQGPAGAGSGGAVPASRTLLARVWFTRQQLYFGAGWTRGASGRYTVYSSTGGAPGTAVLAFASDRYELLVELPRDDAGLRRFASALADSFALFFSEAATDADISFPAFVDYAP